jgi:hypothetical protein
MRDDENYIARRNRQVLWSIFLHVVIIGSVAYYVYARGYVAYFYRHNNDFKHIYLGADLLASGQNPYADDVFSARRDFYGLGPTNPYVYPPFTGLMLSPLTLLHFDAASSLWFFLNHFFLLASFVICFRAFKMRQDLETIAFAAIILAISFPFHRTLTAGQLNCALLFLYSLIWLAYRREQLFNAGLIGAFAMLFRLTPSILLVFLACRKQWRILWYTLLGLTFLFLLSVALSGWSNNLAYLPVLRDMGYGRSTWAQYGMTFYADPFNQSFNSLFHHLVARNPYTRPLVLWGPEAANALTAVVSLILLVVVIANALGRRAILSRDEHSDREALVFSTFIFLSLFIPSLYWDHNAVLLFFPMLLVYKRLREQPKLFLTFLFALSIAVISMPVRFDAPSFRLGAGILLMSVKLWATLLLFFITLFLSRAKPLTT